MKYSNLTYDFDPEKNLKLKEERDISFEEIVTAIEEGHLIEVIDHHSTTKYKHQKIYVVEVESYIYLVPFVEQSAHRVFLKTIFPSSKFTRKYLHQLKGE